MQKTHILVLAAILIIAFALYFFIFKPGERFEIIHYSNITDFSEASSNFSQIPNLSENYWIKYDNETIVYVSRLFFNNSESSSGFSEEMLNMFEKQIKVMENYSFGEYSGYYVSDGKKSNFYLLKDNVFLMFGGEERETTEKVVEWFIEKFG